MGARKKKSKKPSATKAELLLEQTTFFADRCLGHQAVALLRAQGLTVEIHGDHFAEDAPDAEWLVEVGARKWVVLTKDKAIRRNSVEREAVMAANVRLFTLSSGNMTGQEMAQRFLDNRLRMGRFLKDHPGPFVASVSREGVLLLAPLTPPTDPIAAPDS